MVQLLRFLVLAFPAQGCINPSLNLAKTLTRLVPGAQVTFVTSVHAHRLMTMNKGSSSSGYDSFSFAPFSDGFDDNFTPVNGERHLEEFRRHGWQAVGEILESGRKEGRPFTCLVYTFLLSWAADLAAEHNVPAAMFWMQPATVFNIYYYYFHGHREIVRDNSKNPSFSLSFPGVPLAITIKDLPSFMDESTANTYFIRLYQEMIEELEKENTNTKIVLANTFDELEPEAIRATGKLNVIGIGPLIPADQAENKSLFRGDLFKESSRDYIDWLNTKPKTTVVYVSFGSISVLSKQQMEEMAKALLEFGRPFLWVIREKSEEDDELSCREELEKLGMIVPWCSQMEVLSNESVGCFVTHCGWNSTLESLASGVPTVGFPQWVEQGTNAKLIEEMWKTGVRLKPNDEDGIVKSEEIKRCLELVLLGGKENGVEIVKNAKKWRNLVKEATREGGSSKKNFMAFLKNVMN
ncbi:phloretin 4'-O-glucosyltransferase-like [Humulus lupulus]|uniref:phloretin 4'-O-glucosyltransferase-like n=1 Tax=Humulus lupulus TaxID=3486 RepID=UPI002B4055F4|nr:phloretin 4'-O-glucosyltransferase-like [Humulus lupulus]